MYWEPVITCEHASNDLPEAVGDLGLSAEALASHVAWDPGASEVATALGVALGVRPFLGRYSRLYADLNRSPGHPGIVPAIAFGVPVPGNHGLPPEAIALRVAEHHRPFWDAVAGAVAQVHGRGAGALHISMHSFTPELNGVRRELDLGVLFDPDHASERAFGERLIASLAAATGLIVRANEPYDGRLDGLCTSLRGQHPVERYAGIEIEIGHRVLDRLAPITEAVVAGVRALLV